MEIPAIYYEVGDVDDLVYVQDSLEGTGPELSQEEFINRVIEVVEEQKQRSA